mgnify:CR=1 FL=1
MAAARRERARAGRTGESAHEEPTHGGLRSSSGPRAHPPGPGAARAPRAQADSSTDWVRRAIALPQLEEAISSRRDVIRRLYVFWSKVHYDGTTSRKAANTAALGISVDKALGPKAVAAPVTAVGAKGAAREARGAEAERRREEAEAQLSADAELLRQMGAAAEQLTAARGGSAGGDGWEYAGVGSGDGLNFNHFLAMLAEAGLLANRPASDTHALSAVEAVRAFEQATNVRGILPRVCRANADYELTPSEWSELLVRACVVMSRRQRAQLLGTAGAADEGAPLARLFESLIDGELVPQTERRIAALIYGATAAATQEANEGKPASTRGASGRQTPHGVGPSGGALLPLAPGALTSRRTPQPPTGGA